MAIVADNMASFVTADKVHFRFPPNHLDELPASQAKVDFLILFQDLGVIRIRVLKRPVDVTLQNCSANAYAWSAKTERSEAI